MKSRVWYVPAIQAAVLGCVVSFLAIERLCVLLTCLCWVASCLILAVVLLLERRHKASQILTACLLPAVLFVGLTCSHLPLKLAFASQRRAFDQAAEAIVAGDVLDSPRWFGPFRIVGGGVRSGTPYLTVRGEVGNLEVFARDPDGGGFNIWTIIRLDGQWAFIAED